MRWLRDIVAVLGASAIICGYVYTERQKKDREAMIERAATDLRRMELEVKYRAATKSTDLNGRGWPVTIDPAWFDQNAPANPLLDDDRPWVEVASTAQADLLHPPVRMAVDNSFAAYWYNPYQGIVRARVPVLVVDEAATQLYNRINGTGVTSIFSRETPARPAASSAPDTAVKPSAEPAPAASEQASTNGSFQRIDPKAHKPAR